MKRETDPGFEPALRYLSKEEQKIFEVALRRSGRVVQILKLGGDLGGAPVREACGDI